MAHRTRLAQYVLDRIVAGGETPEEFAVRAGINASGLYKFLRGAYAEPRQTTLDKIAAGLAMTPAELLVATGKGAPADDPEEVEFLALIRQVPSDKRPAAIDMLRGLAVQPTRKESANRRRDGAATGPNGPRRKLEAGTASAEERTAHGGLSDVYRRPGALWASVIAVVGRLLQPSHAWSTAEAG